MNKRISAIGLAKQVDKSTPAANPTFWAGVVGGKLVDFEVDQKGDEVTTGLAGPSNAYREAVSGAADFSTRAYPKMIGALLLAVLGNIATSGTGPYTHVMKLGDTVAYYTIFSKLDTELRLLTGAKLDELKIAFSGTKPLEVNATFAGMLPGWPATITVPVNDERLASYFKPVSGTFEWAVSGTVMVPLKISAGTITMKRNCEGVFVSSSVVADDVEEGGLDVSIEFDARVTDLTAQRTIITGTANGTTVSQEPIYGAFSWKFVNGADELTLASERVPWTTETPEADPKGGGIEAKFKGDAYIPAGQTSQITATLKNSVATYT